MTTARQRQQSAFEQIRTLPAGSEAWVWMTAQGARGDALLRGHRPAERSPR